MYVTFYRDVRSGSVIYGGTIVRIACARDLFRVGDFFSACCFVRASGCVILGSFGVVRIVIYIVCICDSGSSCDGMVYESHFFCTYVLISGFFTSKGSR
jgi:hypothetical protein